MFENPIMFSMLVSIIITLGYFFMNKEKDKKDPRPEKNMKYMILFGVMFIISLIGKICYSGSIDIIEGTIEKDKDGSCVVSFTFQEDEWVYGYILSFGQYVEVLEPPHVREIIIKRLSFK